MDTWTTFVDDRKSDLWLNDRMHGWNIVGLTFNWTTKAIYGIPKQMMLSGWMEDSCD